jgi:hypothetical protein
MSVSVEELAKKYQKRKIIADEVYSTERDYCTALEKCKKVVLVFCVMFK